MKHHLLGIVSVICFFLLGFIQPVVAEAKPRALFNYSTAGKCRVVNIGRAPSAPVIPRQKSGSPLDKNLIWFGSAISSAKANQKQAQRLAQEMSVLARNAAFTQLDWSGSGGSPAHWQSNLLKNVAIAVNVVDHRNAWSGTQRSDVISWGDTLWKNSHYSKWGRSQSNRWPDTVAAASAAYILWGVAAPNKRAYSEGKRDYAKVARMLKLQGGTQEYLVNMGKYSKEMAANRWHARIEDKTLGDLVIAAHAAGRNGDNLFKTKRGKASLYQAIVGWQYTLFGDGGSAVKGMDLSFLTTNGAERSWSWTEYWVANFPADQATAALRKRSSQIAQRSRYGYVGRATGPSTCLFR